MEGSKDIMPVIHIDKTGVVIVESSRIVEYVHSSNSSDPSADIVQINIADLCNPTVVVIVYWNVLYLYNSTIIIVLNIGIVIKA